MKVCVHGQHSGCHAVEHEQELPHWASACFSSSAIISCMQNAFSPCSRMLSPCNMSLLWKWCSGTITNNNMIFSALFKNNNLLISIYKSKE